MSRLKAVALLCGTAVLTALPCVAGEYDYGEDMLSAEELAALELAKRKEAPPRLAVSPASLTCSVKQGETANLRLTVRNAGGQSLKWSMSSAPTWVHVKDQAGALGFGEERLLTVVIDPRGLPVGERAGGNMVIEAGEVSGSPATVPVTLVVQSAAPRVATPVTGTEPEKADGEPLREPRRRPERGRAPRTTGGPTRGKALAVRAGYLMPGRGERGDFAPGAAAGFYYSLRRHQGARLSYEIGMDVVSMQAADDTGSSQAVAGRFDLLFSRAGAASPTRPYLLSGVGALAVSSEADSGGGGTAYVGGLNLGAGLGLGNGRYDVRLTHALLVGSENVKGLTLLSVALAF